MVDTHKTAFLKNVADHEKPQVSVRKHVTSTNGEELNKEEKQDCSQSITAFALSPMDISRRGVGAPSPLPTSSGIVLK